LAKPTVTLSYKELAVVSTLATPEAPRVEENTTVFSTRTRNFNNRLGNGAQAYLSSADQANRSNQSEPIAQRLIKISEELRLKLADHSSNGSCGHSGASISVLVSGQRVTLG